MDADGTGDVVDLLAELDGVTSLEAARKLCNGPTLDQLPNSRAGMFSEQPEPKPEPYQLSHGDIRRIAAAAQGLPTNEKLIERLIAKRPEWSFEAIRGAALEGDLGYEDGKILFSYRNGIKARWKDAEGKRVIRWLRGSANGQCWRQSLLLCSHRTAYITEGETDALTLLSFGIEEPGNSIVLALGENRKSFYTEGRREAGTSG